MAKKILRAVATTVVFLVGIALILGSATGPREVTQYKFEPKADSSTEFEQDNLIVRIRAIDQTNFKQFPSLMANVKYASAPGRKKLYKSSIRITQFPAFELSITNNTGHVIRFSKAIIKMEDDAGNMYDARTKTEMVAEAKEWSENQADENEQFYGNQYINQVKKVKVVDNNFELLPNYTQKGYLLFNIDQMMSTEEYADFVTGSDYFKVMLYEIPVGTDAAGNATKTTNFQFVYVVNEKVVTVQ